jgi:hypothetical protein
MRRLRATRRHVPLDMSDDYLLAWHAAQRAVEAAAGRAWIFRRAGHEDQFLEFIEWSDSADSPLENGDVAAAVAQLDAFGAASADEWEQAT